MKAVKALALWGLAWVAAVEPVRSVPFNEVKLLDNFWAPRIETNRMVTIPHLMRELERQGSLGGFRILAGDKRERYHGYMWGDSDVYKTVEGMTAALRLQTEPGLEQSRERVIRSIVGAQAADGYLFPYLQIMEPGYRHFAEEATRTCESYSIGHLLEAAVADYDWTGRTNFLAVAQRAAELIRRTHAGGELLRVSGHPEIELALIKLHEATGEGAWLELAASLVKNAERETTLWSQGRAPLAGDEARGHAVAMLYLYTAATEVARLKGEAELGERLCRKWTNLVSRKLYVTGGLGHSGHSEGFADDYDLPNDSAYCETCAAIANVFWQHRLFLAHGDARYVDVLERSLYNNVVAGAGLSGDRFFYVNPVAADGQRKFNQGLAERFAWTGCPCCPVNLVRLLPRVGDYFYAVRGGEVFVNLFGASEARLRVAGGELRVRQETRYPWEGRVRMQVESAPTEAVALHVRIPGWARGRPVPSDLYRYVEAGGEPVRLWLNREPLEVKEEKGYAVVRRVWRAGDVIDLELPMTVRRVVAHERVREDAGRVAIERGPLVYCAEGVDNGGQVQGLVLPPQTRLERVERSDLMGGVTVLEGDGQRVVGGEFRRTESTRVRLVPYYAWNHRGVGPMAVWLPTEAQEARVAYDTSKWVGANYTPAYAANQVQMWHEFRPEVIERELAAAHDLGLNTLRVYLHYINYREEKELWLQRIEAFLEICQRHGVRPGFTFFDDCWNHSGVTLETPAPVAGRHNGRWAAVQDADRKDENLGLFKAYVQDVVRGHTNDPRVLWWEVYNEPNRRDAFTQKLCENGRRWIKELRPAQPVLCCWDDNAETDIVDAHNYEADFGASGAWDRQAEANPHKGTVFTEAGARWYGGKPRSSGSPIEVIRWLRGRQAAGKGVPGVYLCWELMVGHSNCRWYWGTADGAPEPAIPWCGLLWPDGSPVSWAEAEAIRHYTTGQRRALLFEDFRAVAEETPRVPPGWIRYAERTAGAESTHLALSGRTKMVAGETAWGDYLLEATVMLKRPEGNAGLVFRVNAPGPGADEMRGYYAGFGTNTLYVGRINGGWQPLATVELARRQKRVELDTWHLLRVAAQGDRIRVWFDPVANDTKPLVDLADGPEAVLQGAIGVRVFEASAWFQDLVVLPSSVLDAGAGQRGR
jgi:uncharacterized protein